MLLVCIGSLVTTFATAQIAQTAQTAQNVQPEVLSVRMSENGMVGNPLIAYRRDLLALAIRAAGREPRLSDCALPKVPLSDRRMIREVAQAERCDVLATTSGGEASRRLAPVPVPIYLGGGGYRVLLVNEAGQRRVESVVDPAELRTLRLGSGNIWADTDVWERNGYTVEKAEYQALFSMLWAGRFDALPRSAFEILAEHQTLDRERHFIEPRFLFRMAGDLFFYVSPRNVELRDTLALGLRRLYCSGEFERFLRSHASTRDVFSRLLAGTRRIVELDTPPQPPTEAQALLDHPPPWLTSGPRAATCLRTRPPGPR